MNLLPSITLSMINLFSRFDETRGSVGEDTSQFLVKNLVEKKKKNSVVKGESRNIYVDRGDR